MEKHPIGDLMETTMKKIREMVDVNTIVGAPITTPDGITLIPISKVSFGFAAGGSDFQTKNHQPGQNNAFGGGSGAGVTIAPVAFITVKDGVIKLMSVNPPAGTAIDRIVELVPEVLDKVKEMMSGKKDDNE
ncbi:MAG: sporulation protein YtfJ [Clostridiales bacterium]|jgi:sporulation protein YtfJ|nr:sporulation protein YtfJ [Clostridiales bacterium]